MRLPSILITDDESNIRLMLRTAMETEGFDVLEAANGRDALETIRRDKPDVMILDLNMPVMDGMAVLEQLKSMPDPKPRVVVLTAYGSIPAAVNATRLGALDFLEKPITPGELRDTVRSVLNEPELDLPATAKTTEDYEAVLMRIRRAMLMEDFSNAETLLAKAADRKPQSAAYFNLLGILYEVQHKWRLAKKCYGKAIRIDRKYQPAQANMRRIFELFTFGHSKQLVMLGDELGALAELQRESSSHGAFK